MKPDFDLSALKGRKLFVGTPMYDGKCFSDYAFSIVRLTALCTQIGIELRYFFRSHEALIANARNETVEQFLLSGCDSLIFIDADIGFDARDVLQLFAMQIPGDSPFDILAAPYPLKQIDWARVLHAAKAGLADEDPTSLARYSSGMRVDLVHGTALSLDTPAEVIQAGTGFMLIRRALFDWMRAHFPEQAYRREGSNPAAPPFAFFETEIDRESGLHVSEDYAFCRRARTAGLKVWLCPWVELTHSGHHRFDSRLADLGAIGPIR